MQNQFKGFPRGNGSTLGKSDYRKSPHPPPRLRLSLLPPSCYFPIGSPGLAELADAADSKSAGDHSPCGFDSLLRDQLSASVYMAVSHYPPSNSVSNPDSVCPIFVSKRSRRIFCSPGPRPRDLRRTEQRPKSFVLSRGL